jgi:hypothetical protein
MNSRISGPRLWLSGLGSAGLAVSHLLAYRLGHTDPAVRTHVLDETGHAYMPTFVTISMFLAVLGLVFFAARRFFAKGEAAKTSFAAMAIALLALQAFGFFGLEITERFLSGHGISLAESPVLIALAVQIGLAVGGAILVRALARVVDVIKDLVASRIRNTTEISFLLATVLSPSRPLLSGGRGLRGPPVL